MSGDGGDENPLDVVYMRLNAARAMLDVLLELTYAKDADERLESLGVRSLSNLVYAAIENIDEAVGAVDRSIPDKVPPLVRLPENQTAQ